MKYLNMFYISILSALLYGCASAPQQQCPPDTLRMQDWPPANAGDDEKINDIEEIRTWVPPSKLTIDPIEFGETAKIPVNSGRAKIIGPSHS